MHLVIAKKKTIQFFLNLIKKNGNYISQKFINLFNFFKKYLSNLQQT